mgnify:CR=1 FL=1
MRFVKAFSARLTAHGFESKHLKIQHKEQICFNDFIDETFYPHSLIYTRHPHRRRLFLMKHTASLLCPRNNTYKGVEADLRFVFIEGFEAVPSMHCCVSCQKWEIFSCGGKIMPRYLRGVTTLLLCAFLEIPFLPLYASLPFW